MTKEVEAFRTLDRNFEGVWIENYIWASNELNITQKVFLMEIESLDNGLGCTASNGYFEQFGGLKKSQTSDIIKQLKEAGFITVTYYKNGKVTHQGRGSDLRVLRINKAKLRHMRDAYEQAMIDSYVKQLEYTHILGGTHDERSRKS